MEEILSEKKLANKPSEGKKPKPPLREKRLNIRFSDKEFALLKSRADGLNLARYARAMLTTGKVNRRQRDFPSIDPRLMREIKSMGKNINQLVRYVHTESNAKRPIDALNLALAIDRFTNELAALKQQYQVQISANDFEIEQFEDDMNETIDEVGDEKNSSGNMNTHTKKSHDKINVEETS